MNIHSGKLSLLCAISWFRRGVNEIFALLGRYEAWLGSYLPKFWDKPSVPSSRIKEDLDHLTLEDGTDALSRNVGN
jgi:hypothetical protein